MSEWKASKLKDLTTKIGSGATPKGGQEAYHDSGISLIRSQNVLDFEFSNNGLAFIDEDQAQKLSNVVVEDNDVLINITGDSVARVCKVPSDILPARVNQHVSIVRPNTQKVDPEFLLYFLLNPVFKKHLLRLASDGGTRNALTKSDLEGLEILVPSLDEQKDIAAILSCLDRKIENLRRQNETLDAIAQSLFKHWFVDFEFPNADGKPYKSSGGEMVPSELGEIPAGWRIGKLRDITEVINGRAYKQTEFKEEGTPIVRIQNLTGKGQTVYSDLDLDVDKYISKGDLIYAWSATFGPYIWRGVKSIYHYHIWKLKCFNPAFKYYLYIHLKKVSDRVKSQGTGSIFTHITKQLMESQELFVPNDDVLEQWHALATSIFDKIMSNHEQIETLTNTRDVLLPKLMSGKLRITS